MGLSLLPSIVVQLIVDADISISSRSLSRINGVFGLGPRTKSCGGACSRGLMRLPVSPWSDRSARVVLSTFFSKRTRAAAALLQQRKLYCLSLWLSFGSTMLCLLLSCWGPGWLASPALTLTLTWMMGPMICSLALCLLLWCIDCRCSRVGIRRGLSASNV